LIFPRRLGVTRNGVSSYTIVSVFLELIKFRITVLVAFTTALGYVLAANELTFAVFYPVAGIFLLACSSSSLNHYQERKTDKLMNRTKSRPLPSGRISERTVLMVTAVLVAAGSTVLLAKTNLLTLGVGLFTFFWYNGVYTPLKKKTAFAILPGALVGALPPLAGWTAAGGNIWDARIGIVALYFFVWQIPHFWLLLMIYGDDFKKAGFPVLSDVFDKLQLKRITFTWLMAAVFIAVFVPMFGVVLHTAGRIILILVSVWMGYYAFEFLRSDVNIKETMRTFVRINFYTMVLITLLIGDRIVSAGF
jgi:protoheme IX farnesyltransferase